jgi:hypothetical protein
MYKRVFRISLKQKKPTAITKMIDEDRHISTEPEIEAHILSFYQALYTCDEQVELNEATRTTCFQYLRPTVTE